MRTRLKEYLSLRKTENNANPGRILRLTVFLFFLFGIFVANRFGQKQWDGYNLWNTYYLDQFKYSQIQSGQLFFYILEERLPILFILLIFIATKWGVIVGLIHMAWQGFAAGYLLAMEIITYGIKGMFFMLLAVFPHYFVYIPIYLGCIYWSASNHTVSWNDQTTALKMLVRYLCVILVFVFGIFLESHVNLFLLKKII